MSRKTALIALLSLACVAAAILSPKDAANRTGKTMSLLPPLPPIFPTVEAVVVPPGTNPPPVWVLPFRYPTNSTDLLWDLQTSTNLTAWTTLKSNCAFGCLSNAPCTTNGDIYSGIREPQRFWRLRGHH